MTFKKCPICQGRLMPPCPENGEYYWLCWDCAFQIDHELVIDAERLMDLAVKQPDPEAFLKSFTEPAPPTAN